MSSTIRINLNIDLLEMPCAIVSVDAQDAMGTHKVDIEGDLKKIRLGVYSFEVSVRSIFTYFHFAAG